ncbi:MAG TPA: TonB-dependent receptor [Sphingomonas sp.]
MVKSISVRARRGFAGLVSTTILCGMAQGAFAQTTPAPAADAAGDGLQPIVVTATRRETNIQNTPMAIDAIGATQLLQTNARSIADVFSQVPAVSVQDQGPGQKRYAIRNITAAGEPEVGLYLDEIPIAGFTGENTDAGAQQPDVKLWDVSRLEVLKGPQGTLYGAGSEGGTIRIISARPNMDKFSGLVSGTLSSLATGGINDSINGTVNVPIVEGKLAIRVNAYRDRDAGYIDEYYLNEKNANWVHTWGGRVNVRYKPTDNWTMDFIAYYQKTQFGDLFNINPQFSGVAGTKWVAANFARQPAKDNFQAYNFISAYDFPWATLTATASWQHRSMDQHKDSTVTHTFSCPTRDYPVCQPYDTVVSRIEAGTMRAYVDYDDVKSWSSEVRLASKDGGPLQWTIGTFYQGRENDFELISGLADGDGNYNAQPNRTKFARRNHDSTRQIAGFGEATYTIVGGLSVTGGVRVFNVRRSLSSMALNATATDIVPGTVYPTNYFRQTSATGKGQINWKVNRNLLFYVEAAEGYRLGGPNLPIGLTYTTPPPYKPDTLWDYEFGWKSSWLDNKLTFNGAAYYMHWSGIQQQGTDVTGAYAYIINAGDARAVGFESELTARPLHWLTLDGGASFTDARLIGAQPVQPLAINQAKTGDPLPFVPKWTLNASAEVNYRLNDYPGWFRAEVSHQTGRATAFDPVSPAYAKLPGWTLVNLSTGVKLAEHYDVTFFVRNLLNKLTYVSGSYNAQTPLVINSSPPRTVGVTVSVGL